MCGSACVPAAAPALGSGPGGGARGVRGPAGEPPLPHAVAPETPATPAASSSSNRRRLNDDSSARTRLKIGAAAFADLSEHSGAGGRSGDAALASSWRRTPTTRPCPFRGRVGSSAPPGAAETTANGTHRRREARRPERRLRRPTRQMTEHASAGPDRVSEEADSRRSGQLVPERSLKPATCRCPAFLVLSPGERVPSCIAAVAGCADRRRRSGSRLGLLVGRRKRRSGAVARRRPRAPRVFRLGLEPVATRDGDDLGVNRPSVRCRFAPGRAATEALGRRLRLVRVSQAGARSTVTAGTA
jgi:hypothetical protein